MTRSGLSQDGRARRALLALPLLLAGCGVTDMFDGSEEPPLEGERISVLQQDSTFNADPSTSAITVVLPPQVSNPDWPQAGGDGDHSMQHLALSASPAVAWRSSAGTGGDAYRPIVSEPVSADGRVFALDAASSLTAIDLASGKQLWRRSLTPEGEDNLFGGGLATDGARVYATTNYGYVYGIDAASGDIAWTTRLNSPMRVAPGLAGDRLIVVTLDNRTVALSTASGEVLWTHSGPIATAGMLGGAAPAVSEGVAIVAYSNGEIFVLDLATGQSRWSDAITRELTRVSPNKVSGITGRIVIDQGLVLVSGNGSVTTAIDLASGQRIWSQPMPSATGPWPAGDFVFVITSGQKLLCLTRATGAVKWFLDLPRFVDPDDRSGPIDWYGPVLAGDRLLMVSTEGQLATVSPYTGELLGLGPVGAGTRVPPIVVAGGVYLLLGDATLVALR